MSIISCLSHFHNEVFDFSFISHTLVPPYASQCPLNTLSQKNLVTEDFTDQQSSIVTGMFSHFEKSISEKGILPLTPGSMEREEILKSFLRSFFPFSAVLYQNFCKLILHQSFSMLLFDVVGNVTKIKFSSNM